MKVQSILHMNLSNFFVNIFKPCTCVEERLLTMKSVCQETCLYRDCRRQALTSVKSTESCLWGREKRKNFSVNPDIRDLTRLAGQ